MKVSLTASWIYGGKVYGPGDADLPEDAHKALGEKGAFTPEAAATEAQKPTDAPQGGKQQPAPKSAKGKE